MILGVYIYHEVRKTPSLFSRRENREGVDRTKGTWWVNVVNPLALWEPRPQEPRRGEQVGWGPISSSEECPVQDLGGDEFGDGKKAVKKAIKVLMFLKQQPKSILYKMGT